MDFLLCLSCAFWACLTLGPAHPTGCIPGLLLTMDVAGERCRGEIKEHPEVQTGGDRWPSLGTELLSCCRETPSSLPYQPITTSTGISQPHHPGTDFPSNKVNLSPCQVVKMPQSSWPVGIGNFEALSTETMVRENTYSTRFLYVSIV